MGVPYEYTHMGRPIRAWANIRIWGRTIVQDGHWTVALLMQWVLSLYAFIIRPRLLPSLPSSLLDKVFTYTKVMTSFEHCTVVYRSSDTPLIQTIHQQANVANYRYNQMYKNELSDIHYGTQTLINYKRSICDPRYNHYKHVCYSLVYAPCLWTKYFLLVTCSIHWWIHYIGLMAPAKSVELSTSRQIRWYKTPINQNLLPCCRHSIISRKLEYHMWVILLP